MKVISNNPLIGGAEAQAFGSFAVELLPDESAVFSLPFDVGHVLVASTSISTHGMVWARGSSTVKYFGGSDFDVLGNTVLSGTTGAAGKLTISTSGSSFYIENRTAGTATYTITFIGLAKGRA